MKLLDVGPQTPSPPAEVVKAFSWLASLDDDDAVRVVHANGRWAAAHGKMSFVRPYHQVSWTTGDSIRFAHEVLAESGHDVGDYTGDETWSPDIGMRDFALSPSGEQVALLAGVWKVSTKKYFTSSPRVYVVGAERGDAVEVYAPTSAQDWEIRSVAFAGEDTLFVQSQRSLHWFAKDAHGTWTHRHRVRLKDALAMAAGSVEGATSAELRSVAAVRLSHRVSFFVAPRADVSKGKLSEIDHVEHKCFALAFDEGRFWLRAKRDGEWEPHTLARPVAKKKTKKKRTKTKKRKLTLEPVKEPPPPIPATGVYGDDLDAAFALVGVDRGEFRYARIKRRGEVTMSIVPDDRMWGYGSKLAVHDGETLKHIALPTTCEDLYVAPDGRSLFLTEKRGSGNAFFKNALVFIDLEDGKPRAALDDAFMEAGWIQWFSPTRILVSIKEYMTQVEALIADRVETADGPSWVVRERIPLKNSHTAIVDPARDQLAIIAGRTIRLLPVDPETAALGKAARVTVPSLGGRVSVRAGEDHLYALAFRKRSYGKPEGVWRIVET